MNYPARRYLLSFLNRWYDCFTTYSNVFICLKTVNACVAMTSAGCHCSTAFSLLRIPTWGCEKGGKSSVKRIANSKDCKCNGWGGSQKVDVEFCWGSVERPRAHRFDRLLANKGPVHSVRVPVWRVVSPRNRSHGVPSRHCRSQGLHAALSPYPYPPLLYASIACVLSSCGLCSACGLHYLSLRLATCVCACPVWSPK